MSKRKPYGIEYERTHGMWMVIEKATDETLGYHHSKSGAEKVAGMLNQLASLKGGDNG
jgi:hypothetical protein